MKPELLQPFFYDITLRDGNQALRKPWSTKQKIVVFQKLLELGVQGIEVGFSGASDMDFEACAALAEIAPKNIVVAGLARAVESDIYKVAAALTKASKQRIHTFIAMAPFNMKYVLRRSPEDVVKITLEAIKLAVELMKPRGGEVQFSAEHFGDCRENLPWVIETFQRIVEAGATIINLPNTVERRRPSEFVAMVEKVVEALPDYVTVAVHCHNDLGMGTATTVESYFAGAIQLECGLNGLGERAGNTNLYEVAVALHNNGVKVPLDLSQIYPIAVEIAELSGIPIHEKAPLIGLDCMAHRSGIHQDGAAKTKRMEKGAYRPIHPLLIGRSDAERLGFTSQSGKTAVYELLNSAGWPITIAEAAKVQPILKSISESQGELPIETIIQTYRNYLDKILGPFRLIEFKRLENGTIKKFQLRFSHSDQQFDQIGEGDGPIAACIDALKCCGIEVQLTHFEQVALAEERDKEEAEAMTIIKLRTVDNDTEVLCRGIDTDTAKANVKAIFNGLNLLEEAKKAS